MHARASKALYHRMQVDISSKSKQHCINITLIPNYNLTIWETGKESYLQYHKEHTL